MDKRTRNLTIGFFLSYFLACFVKLSPSAVMPQIQAELGLNSAMAGLIAGMYFIPYGVMQLLSVPLCKRFGSSLVFFTGLLVSAVGLLVFSLGNSVLPLALGRFLTGVGTGPIFVGIVYHLQGCSSGKDYVKLYGYAIFASNVGSTIASTPLKALLSKVSYNTVFIALMVFSVALGLWILLVGGKKAEKRENKEERGLFKELGYNFKLAFSTPFFIAALLCWLTQVFIQMSYHGLWCIQWSTLAFTGFEGLASCTGLAIGAGLIISGLWGEEIRHFVPQFGRPLKRGLAVWSNEVLILVCLVLAVSCRVLRPSLILTVFALVNDIVLGYACGLMIIQVGAYVKDHTKEGENSSVIGVFNFCGSLCAQISQRLTGELVDAFETVTSKALSFACTYACVCAVILLITIAIRGTLKKNN